MTEHPTFDNIRSSRLKKTLKKKAWPSCHSAPPAGTPTSGDVVFWLDLGSDVRQPKSNVGPTSNPDVNLTYESDVN